VIATARRREQPADLVAAYPEACRSLAGESRGADAAFAYDLLDVVVNNAV
jgi:hypothetical protein